MCNYPPLQLILSNERNSTTIYATPLSSEVDIDEVMDIQNRAALTRFSSTSTSDHSSDQFNILKFNRQLEAGLLTPPSNFPEYLLSSPQLSSSPQSGTRPITPIPIVIPKSLSPQLQAARSQSSQFFLTFHREKITEAHYFRWYDHLKLCTSLIFSMAEQSDPLRHAMVAFSALVYSCKLNRGARVVAFWYYTTALQELRQLLNITPMSMDECLAAVVTALVLSSFDVCSLSASN